MGEAVKDLDTAIGKAVDTAIAPPDKGQAAAAPDKPQVDNSGTGDGGQADGSKAPQKSVWNGDVNSLPPELQEHAKAVQRYVTSKSTEAAEAKKRLEQLEKSQLTAEDRQKFEEWKRSSVKPPTEPTISKEEWEDALLDVSGQKMNSLIRRQAKLEVEQARSQYLAEVQKAQAQQTQLAALEKQVMEFAEVHPDFEKYARMGIMLPIAQEELRNGGSLDTALARARKFESDLKSERDTELKALAEKKRNAASLDGRGPVEDGDVVWVDTREEALERQIEASINKKKISVKVRPKKG